MKRDVIIALDLPSEEAAWAFLEPFQALEEKPFVKVGMELFYAAGPDFVRAVKAEGYRVFLDLKLHDIPNTVAGAVRSLKDLGVDMLTLHASGGREMFFRAREALKGMENPPILLGVTVLTSFSDATRREAMLGESHSVEDTVLHLAELALQGGGDGIVSSAKEAAYLREMIAKPFPLVCPGIRPKGTEAGDQKRVVTPEDARKIGVDYIVVGRPITKAEDPLESYLSIRREFLGGDQ
ncbi:MAG: orotidine-5'-phosphate decarboxylase [Peptoniphilus sp.]|nr:orotidine-5'-phosphate decarboxylase [Peptoniphilus sp.]MDD7363281.1 orotidine-5'-phosphate decarboxylase [Bacillota bacterium]MDY6045374.1 orotidine-5'-phosphate decarboxylase [Peptoniphilus sp.]